MAVSAGCSTALTSPLMRSSLVGLVYLQHSRTDFGLVGPHDRCSVCPWKSFGFCLRPCSCFSPAADSKEFLARWKSQGQIRAQVGITYSKATLASAWQSLMTDPHLGFQLCPWKSFAFAPALASPLLQGQNSS